MCSTVQPSKNFFNVVKLLLEQGADPNMYGASAIINCECLKIMKLFMECDIHPEHKDTVIKTTFYLRECLTNPVEVIEVIELLEEHNYDIQSRIDKNVNDSTGSIYVMS